MYFIKIPCFVFSIGSYILHIDGYWMEMNNSPLSAISKLVTDTWKQYQLSSLQPTSLYFLSPLTTPTFFPSGNRGLVFSSNHFKDSVLLQVNNQLCLLYKVLRHSNKCQFNCFAACIESQC